MGKIHVDRVEIKNFFSYGNQWTDFSFEEGINVILGHDVTKDRSNGAGKTSFLEAIPFALFGQTSKGVSQNKIVNWKNGKQCEVRLHFTKDGIPYVIHRGIKPGILELYKDGIVVPKLSDKRIFQQEIETDLIGMDYKAAQALLFQNTNTMISMFDTKKEDKRRFIEKLFNLEQYSKMNELVNRKLTGISKKLDEIDLEIGFKQKRIAELTSEIESFQIPNLDAERDSLRVLEIGFDVVRYEESKEKVSSLKLELSKLKSDKASAVVERNALVDSVTVASDKCNKIISDRTAVMNRQVAIGDISTQKDTLKRLTDGLELIKDVESQLLEAKQLLATAVDDHKKISIAVAEANANKTHAKKEMDAWVTKDVLDEAECPVCFNACDPDTIRGHIEAEISRLNEIYDVARREYETLKYIEVTASRLVDDAVVTVKGLESKCEKKVLVERKIAELSGVGEKELELAELEVKLDILTEELDSIDVARCIAVDALKEFDCNFSNFDEDITDVEDQIELLEDYINNHERLEIKIQAARDNLNSKEALNERLTGERDVKIASKAQLELEVSGYDADIKKLNTMKDYMEHVKFTLKDENVKQYAISNIVPFLTQQTNHYLSESGHNYYIKLNNWLEGEIMGHGVGECDFGNMSSGEGKSIDLAMKFAMMDVARMQAGSYLDILVLDELLDSSIDSHGLEAMVDIVRLKQREDNLKVFIVSHREEVSDFGADFTYKVSKRDGFSSINMI